MVVGGTSCVFYMNWWEGEPYLTRAFLINAANPVRHYYPDTYWKETLSNPNVELVVMLEVLPSDTAPTRTSSCPTARTWSVTSPPSTATASTMIWALTTRYAAVPPLYDTEETADVLFKMTEIISGNTDKFLDWVEKLTGLKADPVKAAYAQTRKTHAKGAFAAACRQVSFAQTAARLGTAPERIDAVLRERGIYQEEDKDRVLEHWGMPRQMPVPTESGRVEFFSHLMRGLRDAGHTAPNFSVLATWIAPVYRDGKPVTEPLEEDEFYFTYGKTPTVSHASTNSNNPVLAGINAFKGEVYKGVWIHPDRAERLGIRHGDPIRLTNTKSGQHTGGNAHLTRLVHPDTLFIYSSFGVENKALSRT
jgi:anaerobic selenocysteine-containing dehydrogenase